MPNKLNNILICQTAHIGDVIASLPLAHVIKQNWPDCQITFLCARYTADACMLALDIDKVIIWDDLKKLKISKASKYIKQIAFDAVIHANSKSDISKIMYKAGIKIRIDQGRRLYKRLYSNKRLPSWRFQYHMHETERNLSFLSMLNILHKYDILKTVDMIRLKKPITMPNILKYLYPRKFNLIFHPFSNQSAREWPLEYFFELIKILDLSKYHIIITGSHTEGVRLKDTSLNNPKLVTNICGKTSLNELFYLLTHVDGIVVSSTGPLHIAAALGTRCLGLFPNKDTMSKNRWQALGLRATSIATDKPCPGSCSNTDCACMRALTPQMVQGYIEGWYLAWQNEKDSTQIAQELHT